MAVSGLSTAGAAGLAVHEPVLNGELNAGLLVDDEWDDLEERGIMVGQVQEQAKCGKMV